jgi:hypothetical protein
MESAVAGVAGDEVSTRWLAEVKNMTNSVRWRSGSGGISADSGTAERKLEGGASQRGERGGE